MNHLPKPYRLDNRKSRRHNAGFVEYAVMPVLMSYTFRPLTRQDTLGLPFSSFEMVKVMSSYVTLG